MDNAPAVTPSRLLYSPSETEKLLGISHATVYRLLRAGRLKSVKIGAVRRITAASIENVANPPAAVGASPQSGPQRELTMGPGAVGEGALRSRSRSRSLRHRRDRADEPTRTASSG
jgi:excisionase family DNA binding protein